MKNSTMNSYDIIFCSIPPMSLDRVYQAPALLKSVALANDYRAATVDTVMDLFVACGKNPELFDEVTRICMLHGHVPTAAHAAIIDEFVEQTADKLVRMCSKYVGFSVFSIFSHYLTVRITSKLRQVAPATQIVLGGRGLGAPPFSAVQGLIAKMTDSAPVEHFGDAMKLCGLADIVIEGDGEEAILDLLTHGAVPSKVNKVSKMSVIYPNYDDYDFDHYLFPGGVRRLDVTGSRGCVRNCDFCDVRTHFGKFNYKQGAALAEELIHYQQQYGVSDFNFTDSLVNGGLKPFKEFMSRLAAHNRNSATKINWSGSYICRDTSVTTLTDDYFALIKESGGCGLTIGAESGSNRVLRAMDKKTTVEALHAELAQFHKFKVTSQLLTFVGHWREEHDDFLDHCRMLVDVAPYVKSGTVSAVFLGHPFVLLRGSPSFSDIGIIKDKVNYSIWIARSNRGNTLKTRAQRRLLVSKLALELGMITDYHEELHQLRCLLSTIVFNNDRINEFFVKHAKGDSTQFDAIANIDSVIASLLHTNSNKLSVVLGIEASGTSTPARMQVKLGDDVLFADTVPDGPSTHYFTHELPDNSTCGNLAISLLNKGIYDTITDENGAIVKDKYIKVTSLSINGCDIGSDIERMRAEMRYESTGENIIVPGLWHTDTMSLNFELPVTKWFTTAGQIIDTENAKKLAELHSELAIAISSLHI